MEHLGQFILNHWQLSLAFMIIFVLALGNELYSQKKRAKELSTTAAIEMINNEQAIIIDIRDQPTFRAGHITDAVHASIEDFSQQRMDKYKTKPIILVCAKGLQSATLAAKLRTQGFTQPFVLSGGIAAWQAADLPLIKGKK